MAEILSFKVHEDKYTDCKHLNILVDEAWGYIECADCHKHLDPIQYLYKIATKERLMEFRRDQMEKFEQDILKKNKTKCEHCGKMATVIK